MASCLFCKIINKEIPADIVYEDKDILAFMDIAPKAPVHILIIPKKHLANINEAGQADRELISKMIFVAKDLAKEYQLDQSGYRLVSNSGPDSGQIVFHLHFHLLGGQKLGDIA